VGRVACLGINQMGGSFQVQIFVSQISSLHGE